MEVLKELRREESNTNSRHASQTDSYEARARKLENPSAENLFRERIKQLE